MEYKESKLMTPFDCLVTPSYLYTLKLLLPYTPVSTQHFLACYIKILELYYTISSFQGFPAQKDSGQILTELKSYMEKRDLDKMEQIETLMNMMDMIQSMQSMSGFSSENTDGINSMDFIKEMLNPEQKEMFQTYSQMFENDFEQFNSETSKGDLKNE